MLCTATPAISEESRFNEKPYGYDELCYAETLKTNRQALTSLSTVSCDRALRNLSVPKKRRSIIYHNKGIIQLAQGELKLARDSFQRSVDLSRVIDKRNIALAQTAHKIGDYVKAAQQYDLLITNITSFDDATMQIILRNRSQLAVDMPADLHPFANL